jgi:hypothetical protein
LAVEIAGISRLLAPDVWFVALCSKSTPQGYLDYLKERHIDCIFESIIPSSPSAIIREDINIYDEISASEKICCKN